MADAFDHGERSPCRGLLCPAIPFYTGKQKILDTAGRVEKFNQKYGKRTPAKAKEAAA